MRKTFMLALAATAALLCGPAQAGPSGYHVVDRVAGPDGGWDFLRVDESANRLLVTRGTSVMAVDLATGQVTAGLSPGQRLHDALPVNGGKELLVTAGGTNTVIFADAKSGATLASVPVGANPDAAAYDPHTGLALVMDHTGGDVALIDPRAHQLVARIPVGGDLETAVVDGAGRAYVNIENTNETAVVDLVARRVVRRIPLSGCDGPTGSAYDARRHWLIAACDGSTVVTDARTGAHVATLKSGKAADGAVFDPRQDLAFVAGRDGTLSVISLKGPKPAVVEVVPTEPSARTLALDPRSGRIYLPAARLVETDGKPVPQPGTFKVLVVAR